MSEPRLKGKIALITGASRGIGRAIAERYIREGAKVIALARNIPALEELDDYARKYNNSITILPLDLSQLEKIDQVGLHIYQKFGKLDIFIANAAILGVLTPLTHLSPSVWDDVIKINLTANYRLLCSLDPILNRSSEAKVIFISSSLTKTPVAYWGAYTISKTALEALALTYSKEVNANIKVEVINLDAVATDMLATAMPGCDFANITKPHEITDMFV